MDAPLEMLMATIRSCHHQTVTLPLLTGRFVCSCGQSIAAAVKGITLSSTVVLHNLMPPEISQKVVPLVGSFHRFGNE